MKGEAQETRQEDTIHANRRHQTYIQEQLIPKYSIQGLAMTASVTRCSHIYPKTRKAGENKGIQKRHPKQFNALLLREKKKNI